MTWSNGNFFCVTGPLWGNPSVTGGFPAQRQLTQSFVVFFDLRLNKRMSKQSRRRWFGTPSRSLWRHCYGRILCWRRVSITTIVTLNQLMMTSSNGNIFRVTDPLCGEFTGPGEFPTQRPVTRSFDVFFDLRLNKRLSKQPWDWWFETLLRSLWRHCYVRSVTAYMFHWTMSSLLQVMSCLLLSVTRKMLTFSEMYPDRNRVQNCL